MTEMLSDVHEGLEIPFEVVDSAVVRGKYEFYHYSIDGVDDRVSGVRLFLKTFGN